MKRIMILAMILAGTALAAQNKGEISESMLAELRSAYQGSPADKAVRNALGTTPIATLAINADNAAMIDTHFSDEVKTKAITNQKKSGRCWLFTGLNVLRADAIQKHNLGDFQFSQAYLFFYDQLEKSNLFLQGIIDTRDLPMSDRKVDWLFSHPLSDGGTFTGVADLVTKYGVVPSEVFPESYTANNTAGFRTQLTTLLRQDGLALRDAGKKEDLIALKTGMLKEIYRLLVLAYGLPPTEFEWTRYDKDGKAVSTKTYTPQSFYAEYSGKDLQGSYVMLMNDPCHEYGKVYEIDMDRHTYDGHNWLYLNLPVERIKEMAVASIKGCDAMYFSCDVGKFLDRERGVADLANFDYGSLLGVQFTMDKKQRVMTHASGSSHAMTLVAVDIKDGKTVKWMVENSWGAGSGYKGKLIMTDEWFDNYMFRLVVDRKYVPADILGMFSQKPVQLPRWDPMFLEEE